MACATLLQKSGFSAPLCLDFPTLLEKTSAGWPDRVACDSRSSPYLDRCMLTTAASGKVRTQALDPGCSVMVWPVCAAGVTPEDLEGLGLGQARTTALVQCLTHAGRLALCMHNGQRRYNPMT